MWSGSNIWDSVKKGVSAVVSPIVDLVDEVDLRLNQVGETDSSLSSNDDLKAQRADSLQDTPFDFLDRIQDNVNHQEECLNVPDDHSARATKNSAYENGSIQEESGGECGEHVPEEESENDTSISFLDEDGSGIGFGDVEIVEFEGFGDVEIVVRAIQRHPSEIRACKMVAFDEHLLTHYPASSSCDICKTAKRRKARFKRGTASGFEYPHPFLVADWLNPKIVASNGARYVLVVKWVQTGAVFGVPCKTKKDGVVPALDMVRKEWKIEHLPFRLHVDGERVLLGPEVEEYLRAWSPSCPGGTKALGCPHMSNTNSIAEQAVRHLADGVRCILMGSGLPTSVWPFAVEYFSSCQSKNVAKMRP